MAKKTEVFNCDYCEKSYKTLLGANKHELTCSKNPNTKENIAKKKENAKRDYYKNKAEDIRLTATSPLEVVTRVADLLLEYGIKIKFNSYPTNFNEKVSNSHNSPIDYKKYPSNWCGNNTKHGVPTGYPGYSGRWAGKIEVLKDSPYKGNRIGLSDLTNGASSLPFRFPYINTGSGSSGDNFSMDGMFFIYDFPMMEKEYLNKIDNLEHVEKEYMSTLRNYHKLYINERNKTIKADKELNDIVKIQQELTNMYDKTRVIKESINQAVIDKYNSEKGYKLPNPPSAFLSNSQEIMKIHADVSFSVNHTEHDKSGIISKIDELDKRIKVYIDKNPEIFV